MLDIAKALELGLLFGWLLHKRLDAWVAGLSALLVGAIVFGLLVMPTLARVGALGRVTFASLAGASPWLVLLVFGQVVVLVLILIARVGRKTT
jgi:hypothetical protein